jgi:hypothetical protein
MALPLPHPSSMNRCTCCGAEISGTIALCPHHHSDDMGWAEVNRIMCDFFHRGIVPRRLGPAERDEVTRECLLEAAA